jgi:hypothetical protein
MRPDMPGQVVPAIARLAGRHGLVVAGTERGATSPYESVAVLLRRA